MNNKIKTKPRKKCPVCGTSGNKLYQSLKDRLFGVCGDWNIDQCPNSECGLFWLNPMPKTSELPRLYDNYFTHQENTTKQSKNSWLVRAFRRGGEQYLVNKYGYQFNGKWLDKILSQLILINPKWTANLDFSVFYLNAKQDAKLLEIGCGNGEMLQSMEARGWKVTGVDFDSKSVDVAKNKGLNIYLGTLEEQHFSESSFDAIVMSHVIEHVPDPTALLKECYRILRPNGKLISITPNTNGYLHKKYKNNWLHLDPPRHLHLFNANSLKIVNNQAFTCMKIYSTTHNYSGLLWASRNIQLNKEYDLSQKIPKINKILISYKDIISGYKLRFGIGEGDELVLVTTKTNLKD